MSDLKKSLLKGLEDAVVEMEEAKAEEIAKEYVKNGFSSYDGIANGLAIGMNRAGKLYEEEEYYIPELLMCSDAMYRGLDVLKPYLEHETTEEKLRAVVGVVEGDTHDIGKNLFKIMLETVGFEVFDLGRDIPPVEFIKKVKEIDACLVGMSTLMTTTMDNMPKLIEMLKEESIRENVIVMVGGGPISQSYADKIGADGYAPEASKAARLAKKLVKKLKKRGLKSA